MVIKIVKLLLATLLILMLIAITLINVRLSSKPNVFIAGRDTIPYHLVKELRGLKKSLDRDRDIEMQSIYPEGYVFLNAVYSLAWCNFLRDENHSEYFEEGIGEVGRAWTKINSPVGKATFSEELSPSYGSFYNGWSAYVLASKLHLEGDSLKNDSEILYFKQQCDEISTAIRENIYPASYYGGTWPADVTVCVASLVAHDKLFEPRYSDVIGTWLADVEMRLDARGMIPHAVDSDYQNEDEGARGSSMALMLIFLYEIDQQFARNQFALFQKHFLDSKFGLTGVREYPIGESGPGDVDSGPMLLGFGGAATIVGMQTLSLFGDYEQSLKIGNTIEAIAFPYQDEQSKAYLLDALPIADAFITWGHSRMTFQHQEVSFTRFRLYSVLVVIMLSILSWLLITNRKHFS